MILRDISKEIEERVKLIEKIINENLIVENESNYRQREIIEAMNYSIQAGGKRLRPMLLLETSRLFGGDDGDVYAFLPVIELIHTYSLVHDDLPAMDNDEYRRGRKTTHVVYGEAMGILAGDALLNYAFELGVNAILTAKNSRRAAMALKILADKSGVKGMLGGQVIDIQNDGKNIDIETLNYINELKTGALIEAAMMMGAVIAGAKDEEILKIEKIAGNIGKAFQIQDDILDVTGSQEEIGKPVLSDEKNNKTTYVTILGVEKASERVEQLTKEALEMLVSIDNGDNRRNEFLEQLMLSLVYRKK
jgi:geranylgeranyl diphosphate synthase type II